MRRCVLILILLGSASAQPLVLWYRQPAAQWVEALPVGNGRLGAMVFGGLATEHLQLNEDTVWTGRRRDRSNPEAPQAVPEVRKLLFAGKVEEAEALAARSLLSIPRRLPVYQPLGDLRLNFPDAAAASDYRRELDLETAIARVTYRAGGARFTREVFASAPDQLIVLRISCDQPGRIAFSATLDRAASFETRAHAPGTLVMEGQALPKDPADPEGPFGVKFRAEARVVAEGGAVRAEGGNVVVTGADSATLFLAAATDFRERDLGAACARALSAAAKPYETQRAAHIADYQKLFRRVSLSLNAEDLSAVPTGERLDRVKKGGVDLGLEELYFQYGRYLLIASSRPGSMPANLQGIWNDNLAPPWGSKYTININTEMNYWPAEVCNLAELHEALFGLVDRARGPGREVAKFYYKARGFVIHHNTDLWGDAVPIDGVPSGIWPMGGAWLALDFWEHYDFGRDRAFLARRAYPVLKETAEFLLDYLVDDGHGRLVSGPSLSPENRYLLPNGKRARLVMGPAMDTEIARAIFDRVIAAAGILGVDADFARRAAAARDKLPQLKIGRYGQLQEWDQDYEEAEPGHRHISHLFALFPWDQITLRGTPELARAARVSLERRLKAGGGGTGWSRAWVINCWARLEEGDLAHEHLLALLRRSTLDNLFDNHPPFQIDGNFGGTAGMAGMLVESHSGEIALLPALPSAWRGGEVRGLRARGAIGLDIAWKDGKATQATLRAGIDGPQRLRPPRGQRIAAVGSLPLAREADGVVRVTLRAGRSYPLSFE